MGANRSVERDPGKVNMMRSLFLEKILRDRQPERVLLTPEAIGCGLSLPSRRFYLTQCEFVDPEEGAGTDPARTALPDTYEELLTGTQEMVLAVLNSDRFTAHSCIVNESIYFLVCLLPAVKTDTAEERWDLQEELRRLYMRAQQTVWDAYRLCLQMWSSDLILGFEELRTEFLSMANEDLSPITEKTVMFPDDMSPYLLSPVGYAAKRMQLLEQQVISAAVDHDWERCYGAFRQIMDIEGEHYPLRNHIHDRAIERLTEVFAVGGVPMNNAMIPSLRSHVWRKSLQSAVSAEDVDAIVKEVLMTCGELFQPAVSVSARLPEIVEFVDANLFDPNLCADMVCARFGISLSYLSRIFKESQGIKFIDYIHERRVQVSKELLAEREPVLTIQMVAERVGYASTLTFARAFKRLEGMTPGSYRRLYGRGEEAAP